MRGALVAMVAACSSPATPTTTPVTVPVSTPPDASIDAPSAPDAAPEVSAAEQRSRAEAAALAACTERTAKLPARPTRPPVVVGRSRPVVQLAGVGSVTDRYKPGVPLHGPWDGAPLARRLERTVAKLSPCYAEALARSASTRGGIVLGALLEETGALANVRVIQDLTRDAALAACVQERVAGTKLGNTKTLGYGFEVYLDLVFCTPHHGACVIGFDAPADAAWSAGVLDTLRDDEVHLGACFRDAVRKRPQVRGVLEERATIEHDGRIAQRTHEVRPLRGDDRAGTAHEAAAQCLAEAFPRVCATPAPLDTKPMVRTRIWFDGRDR